MRRKLGQNVFIQPPLEWHDQVGKPPRIGPLPGVKLGVRGFEIHVAVGA